MECPKRAKRPYYPVPGTPDLWYLPEMVKWTLLTYFWGGTLWTLFESLLTKYVKSLGLHSVKSVQHFLW